MIKFEKIKNELLERINKIENFRSFHGNIYKAHDYHDLLEVIRNNFMPWCRSKLIDVELLAELRKDICSEYDIFWNESVKSAYVLVTGDNSVKVTGVGCAVSFDASKIDLYDGAFVWAYDEGRIDLHDGAEARIYDNVTATLYDKAKVEAYGLSCINSYNSIKHVVKERAIIRYINENKVLLGDGLNGIYKS